MSTENSDKSRVSELFGYSTCKSEDWGSIVSAQVCRFTDKKCFKIRKSDPSTSIGTCVVRSGAEHIPLLICPNRFLANDGQVFTDCIHLLTCHEPGNELHVVSEVSIPGGSVDYFLVSAKNKKPVDFVGVEFQALDTTGTVWPHRQKFLKNAGLIHGDVDDKNFGVNWKMTAKTILVQIHHKIETFESVNRKLVLILQQELMDYMAREFSFAHLVDARLGDSMHFHPYGLVEDHDETALSLGRRKSTDMAGISQALNLGQAANVELEDIFEKLKAKMSDSTRWSPVGHVKPAPMVYVED